MKRGFIRFSILTMLLAVMTVASVFAQTRNRPAGQRNAPQPKAPASDLTIKYKQTTGGQAMESTTMIKGARQRSEMKMGQGMDMVTITQCDLKRTIQINDLVRKYVITQMETDSANQPATTSTTAPAQASRRGGVVTYTSTAVDTGERKEMYGFTARHVKTSLKMESSPDACSPVNQRMETDGWYIDFAVNFDCDLDRPQTPAYPSTGGGCRDRTQFKRVGAARTGYALNETTTMYGPDGRVTFTSTKEVVELSREPLAASLFDLPAGYAEAQSTQEFYAVPSMDSMVSQANQEQPNTTGQREDSDSGKRAGVLRVGVVTINNKSGKPVSIDALRDRLVGNISSAGIDAVPLNAISQAEAEVEAKTKQCDFILYTDVNSLKSSKVGGMFGAVTGVQGAGKTEAKIEFKLFAIGEKSPRLQSSASAKEEGDEASAGTAIDTEARQVSAAVRKG